MTRAYDAILLDLDGTLVTDAGVVHPHTLRSVGAAQACGVRVMLATGRSEGGTIPVLAETGIQAPAIVYNGAGLYCPTERKLLEERVLSNRTIARTHAFAREHDLFVIVMCFGQKFCVAPRTPEEKRALEFLEDLRQVEPHELPTESVMRLTLFSARHESPEALGAGLDAAIDQPVYLTWFPLCALPHQRENPLLVVDVQPPCRGKGEALRVLEELYSIPPERVVAVGDASNDVPMLEAAGLGVAMENATPDAKAVADRIIGPNNGDAIGRLIDELFLGRDVVHDAG